MPAGPLAGRRVLVTRSRRQAAALSRRLEALGARVVASPAIRIEPPVSGGPMRRAVEALAAGRYDWLVLTSANGVAALRDALRDASLRPGVLRGIRIAAIGSGTAAALERAGFRAALVPERFTVRAVGAAFPKGDGRVLLMRADKADPSLGPAIERKGWRTDRVIAYRIRTAGPMAPDVRTALLSGEIGIVTLASAGTARAFSRQLRGALPKGTAVVAIGPVTAAAVRELGWRVAATADEHTIDGLVRAVVKVAGRQAGGSTGSRSSGV